MKSLMRHQVAAVDMIRERNCALFLEQGCGKTACALMAIVEGLRSGKYDNALIVCPASLVANWEKSIATFDEFEGITDMDIDMLTYATEVTSYTMLSTASLKNIRHRDGSVEQRREYNLRPHVDKDWDIVVADESHAMGSHSSIQTASMLALSKRCARRVIMTGTPDSGLYHKIYGQLRFLDPDYAKNVTAWRESHVLAYDNFHKPSLFNSDLCEADKRKYGLVARLEQCVDMPGYTETVIPCPLKAAKAYHDIQVGCIAPYNIEPNNTNKYYMKLLQVVSGHVKGREIVRFPSSKHDVLMDILEKGRKTVIFATYRQSIDDICEILTKLKLKHVVYDGRQKDPVYHQFQDDPSIDVFVGQYARASRGLNLFAADTMIFYEQTTSGEMLEQARSRIYRTGQTKKCRFVYLTTPNTAEDFIWQNTRKNVNTSREMLDEWAEENLF